MKLARAWPRENGRFGHSVLARPQAYGWPPIARPQLNCRQPNSSRKSGLGLGTQPNTPNYIGILFFKQDRAPLQREKIVAGVNIYLLLFVPNVITLSVNIWFAYVFYPFTFEKSLNLGKPGNMELFCSCERSSGQFFALRRIDGVTWFYIQSYWAPKSNDRSINVFTSVTRGRCDWFCDL